MNTPFPCQNSILTRDSFWEPYFTQKTLFLVVLRKNYAEILPTQNLEDPNFLINSRKILSTQRIKKMIFMEVVGASNLRINVYMMTMMI